MFAARGPFAAIALMAGLTFQGASAHASSTSEQLSFLGVTIGMSPQQVEQTIQRKCDRLRETSFKPGDKQESIENFILGEAYIECQHVPYFDTSVSIQFFFNDNKVTTIYVHRFAKHTDAYPPAFFAALTDKYKVKPKAEVTPIPRDPNKSANFRLEFSGRNGDVYALNGLNGYMGNTQISTAFSLFLNSKDLEAITERRAAIVEKTVKGQKQEEQNSNRSRL